MIETQCLIIELQDKLIHKLVEAAEQVDIINEFERIETLKRKIKGV